MDLEQANRGTPGIFTDDPNSSYQILPPKSIRPGNYDRAWNDPPVFAVELSSIHSKTVPTKLNKRVAYPGLSSGTNAPSSVGVPGLARNDEGTVFSDLVADPSVPPMPSNLETRTEGVPLPLINPPATKVDFIPSFPSPASTPEEDENTSPKDDSKDPISKENILKAIHDSLKRTNFEPTKEGEIIKRLDILSTKWNSLDYDIQKRLNDLGKYLEKEDYKRADAAQLSLSFEYMSQCGQWIMALKQIIRKNME